MTTIASELPPVESAAERTIDDLYVDHRLSLVRLAMLLVDDVATAEDVVQDAFAGLHQRWAHLDKLTNALAYLRTAVVNNARSVLRRRQTARRYAVPHVPDADSAENDVLLADEHRQVREALPQLTPRQREVLVLRYWNGLDEAEIAASMGIAPSTVRSTASRAVSALQELLA